MEENKEVQMNEKGYNLAELYKMSNDNNDFVKEMIRLFIKTTSEGLVAIKRGVKNNSWEYVAYQTHKISAPCKHVEAEKLYLLLKKAEDKVKTDYSTLKLGTMVQDIEEEINNLNQHLEAELAKIQL